MITEKLHEIMCKVETVHKDTTIQGAKFSYTALSETAVLKLVRPMFKESKILVYPTKVDTVVNGKITTATGIVTFVDTADGTDIQVASAGQGHDSQDKGAGKALTYMIKYAILKVLMLVGSDDPDSTGSEAITEAEEELEAYVRMLRARVNNALNEKKIDQGAYEGLVKRLADRGDDSKYLHDKFEPGLTEIETK
jgi:hypothetical protein